MRSGLQILHNPTIILDIRPIRLPWIQPVDAGRGFRSGFPIYWDFCLVPDLCTYSSTHDHLKDGFNFTPNPMYPTDLQLVLHLLNFISHYLQ